MTKRYWLHSGFYTLSDRLMQMIFGFGGLFFLLRLVSKSDFGAWVIFLTIVSFLEVGRIGLLSNALVKYLNTAPKKDYAAINTASFALHLILAAIFSCLLLLSARPAAHLFDAPVLTRVMPIYAVTTLLLTPHFHLTFLQQANTDFRGVFWSNFVKQGMLFAYIAVAYARSIPVSLTSLAWVQLIAALPAGVIAWMIAGRYWRMHAWPEKQWIQTLFGFGKFVMGTNLATMTYKSVDKIWLGLLLSPLAVASYELAIRVSNLAEVPTFAMATILFPQSARIAASDGYQRVSRLYEKSVGTILAIVTPFVLVCWLLADRIVALLGSEAYADAAFLLRLTLLFGLFVPFSVQFGTVLDSISKPGLNFRFTLLSAAVNLASNYVFIRIMGLTGAAVGTLFSFVLMFGLMQYTLHRTIGSHPLRAIPHMFHFYRDTAQYAIRIIVERRAGLRRRELQE